MKGPYGGYWSTPDTPPEVAVYEMEFNGQLFHMRVRWKPGDPSFSPTIAVYRRTKV